MARARKQPDPEPEEEKDDDELEITERDYVMARLAAGRNAAKAACDAIDEAIALFVNPDDDMKGKERHQLVDDALQSLGAATLATQAAEEVLPDVDMGECEPWEDEA